MLNLTIREEAVLIRSKRYIRIYGRGAYSHRIRLYLWLREYCCRSKNIPYPAVFVLEMERAEQKNK